MCTGWYALSFHTYGIWRSQMSLTVPYHMRRRRLPDSSTCPNASGWLMTGQGGHIQTAHSFNPCLTVSHTHPSGVIASDEWVWGSLTCPPPQVGCVWYSSGTPGCPRTKERKENKWLTDRDHSHAGPESPSGYKCLSKLQEKGNLINSLISRNLQIQLPGAPTSPSIHSDVGNKDKKEMLGIVKFLYTLQTIDKYLRQTE